MWKKVPVFAAVLALCACGSAPTIKYPSGSAARVAINTSAPPASATTLPSAATTAMRPGVASQSASVSRALQARAVVNGPPPTPIPVSLFFVNGTEQSTLSVMRRWARAARIDFSWESAVDYPITPAMREITAPDLAGALRQMRAALEGVEEPLEFVLGEQGLVVRRLEPAPVVVPTEVTTAAATADAPQAATPSAVSTATSVTVAATPAHSSETSPAKPAEGAAASQMSSTATPPPVPEKKWTVVGERSLREIVSKWASLEGVEVRWESAKDFPVGDSVRMGTYEGDFRHALGELAGQFSFVDTPLGIRFMERGTVLKVYDLADRT